MSISCIRAHRLLFLLSTDICLLGTEANKFLPSSSPLLTTLPCCTHTGSSSRSRLSTKLWSCPGTAVHKLSHPMPAPLFPSCAPFGCPGEGPQEMWLYRAVTHFPPSQDWHTLHKAGLWCFLHHLMPHGVLTALLSVLALMDGHRVSNPCPQPSPLPQPPAPRSASQLPAERLTWPFWKETRAFPSAETHLQCGHSHPTVSGRTPATAALTPQCGHSGCLGGPRFPRRGNCGLPGITAWQVSKDKPVNYSSRKKATVANNPISLVLNSSWSWEREWFNKWKRVVWRHSQALEGSDQQFPHGTTGDRGVREDAGSPLSPSGPWQTMGARWQCRTHHPAGSALTPTPQQRGQGRGSAKEPQLLVFFRWGFLNSKRIKILKPIFPAEVWVWLSHGVDHSAQPHDNWWGCTHLIPARVWCIHIQHSLYKSKLNRILGFWKAGTEFMEYFIFFKERYWLCK